VLMDYLPLFFSIQGKQCLLVGGGDVALRKARILLSAGAKLKVVSTQLCEQLADLLHQNNAEYCCSEYHSNLLEDVVLVISAIEDDNIDQQVSEDAQQRGLPVNVVDKPALSSFIIPAIVDRSPMVIAISSGGKSPVLARILRGKIEAMIPASYGQLGGLVGRFRNSVKAKIKNINQRRNFWENILRGPVAEMVFNGKTQKAQQLLEQAVVNIDNNDQQASCAYNGEVYLVGGGPGDPDLLTFKALRLMQQADVVVYDRLVSASVLGLCRRDADHVFVGKSGKNHTLPQEDINKLLVKLAQQGKRVLRLKGGDPFVFGRGGEEIDLLMAHDIPFQVVPGITSASACAAYAGIPLTHQQHAQSVRFVTGHTKGNSCELPWQELTQENQTLVVYMGLLSLSTITSQLIEHGAAIDTPIALIENGTLPDQRIITGTLDDISGKAERAQIKGPTLIIIGKVVSLREKLDWYSQN
jgi:uroporphyrin-III C-methyltransferase/precorrin-2 dehydrogenase/sirohydrochlorin ferrochelatase